MAKKKFQATIEVCRSYYVDIWAEDFESASAAAKDLARDGSNLEQVEDGEVEDTETNLVSVARHTDRLMYQ